MLWDLAEGKRLYNLDAGEIIYALCFSPNRYWLCAATTNVIKVRMPSRNMSWAACCVFSRLDGDFAIKWC